MNKGNLVAQSMEIFVTKDGCRPFISHVRFYMMLNGYHMLRAVIGSTNLEVNTYAIINKDEWAHRPLTKLEFARWAFWKLGYTLEIDKK